MHECYLDLSFELATHPVVILYCRTVHWLGLPRTQPHYLLRQSPSPSGKDPVLSQSQSVHSCRSPRVHSTFSQTLSSPTGWPTSPTLSAGGLRHPLSCNTYPQTHNLFTGFPAYSIYLSALLF